MKWRKLGQIFFVANDNPNLRSHAANPLPVFLEEDIYRVFYSGRNEENKSSVGFVDLDIRKRKIIYDYQKTVFRYGEENSFYSHGVSIGNAYEDHMGNCFILFMGWQIREGRHWRGDIGRLQLIEKEKMILTPNIPFIKCDEEDPISLSYPYVLNENGKYRMWYGSTVTWKTENGEMLHVIKHATSSDGMTWKKHGIAIPYELGVAQAFSRPSVIRDHTGYHMWFSYRDGTGKKYRIGYAGSDDGKRWKLRLTDVGIDVSPSGWDSEMICYPYVFDHKGQRYMLYNGNGYGKTGFGLAVLE